MRATTLQTPSGKFSVASAASLLAGGASGPAVQPGRPDDSLLIRTITGDKPRMPKTGAPLKPDQVAMLRLWIEQGARDDSKGKGEQETWWSLRPLVKPPVPTPAGRTSIDAFIQQRLSAAGLAFSPAADRRTLIRRVYYDLHGLPPQPEEIEAFVKDPAPDAYDKLIDRLLDSPRYGERWARHWLDVVHYGDSHGYDKDKPRPNAWPYRDYVISAFNEDKPYSRFIREQIAGDALYPDDPRAFVATGFLAAGPWDFVGHQELREGTAEKDNTRLLDRDDMVATTISTFVSMTAQCARCHNHKFDPIPQTDYYNLQAVFAGIDRADRPFHDDAAVHAQLQQLVREKLEVQSRLQPLLDKVEFATSPEIVDLDSAIQDASLQIAHIGVAEDTSGRGSEGRDWKLAASATASARRSLWKRLSAPKRMPRSIAIQAEMKNLDAQASAAPKPRMVYSGAAFFPRAGTFRPSLRPRPVSVLARGSLAISPATCASRRVELRPG